MSEQITVTVNGRCTRARSSRAGCSCTSCARPRPHRHACRLRHASCGACTVHLDGDAVKSAPSSPSRPTAPRSRRSRAWRRRRAAPDPGGFREHHGLQCGYCTPGMIMAAADLIDKNAELSDGAEVREALAGNLCRCTGYHNIVKAVLQAAGEWRGSDMATVIPRPAGAASARRPAQGGPAVITGRGRYVDDMRLPGMLHVGVRPLPSAHAKIVSIDTSAARGDARRHRRLHRRRRSTSPAACRWPRTRPASTLQPRQHAAGQGRGPLPRRAGRDRDRRRPLPVARRRRAGARRVRPAARRRRPERRSSRRAARPRRAGTNRLHDGARPAGIDAAFAEAARVVKSARRQPPHPPPPIEPRGCSPTTSPASSRSAPRPRCRTSCACSWPSPRDDRGPKVRVVAPDVGGGFGAKLNFYREEIVARVGSQGLGRPIKWIEDRSEDMLATIHGRDQIAS